MFSHQERSRPLTDDAHPENHPMVYPLGEEALKEHRKKSEGKKTVTPQDGDPPSGSTPAPSGA